MARQYRYVVTALTVALLVCFWAADRSLLAAKHARKPAPPIEVPLNLGDWEGTRVPLPADMAALLPRTTSYARHYREPGRPASEDVELVLVSAADISSLHNPNSCYVGAGWSIIEKKSETIPLNPAPAVPGRATRGARPQRTLAVEKLSVVRNDYRLLVLYWYATAGDRAASPTRLGVILNALRVGHDGGTMMVRVTTLVADGDNAALERCTRFIQALAPELSKKRRGR